MSKLEAIFFDHDGTLVDTEPIWAAAKAQVAEEYDKVWAEEDTIYCLGKPAAVTFERFHEIGIDADDDHLYSLLKDKMAIQLEDTTIELLPGISEVLEEIAAANIPAGIVTNATTAVAQHTASLGPDHLFQTIVSDEHVHHAKPNPEPYLLAAQNLGVNPKHCVAIEDSESGARSATGAGMKVIVVPGMIRVPKNLGYVQIPHTELSLEKIQALVEDQKAYV